jgi:hypothetical protein
MNPIWMKITLKISKIRRCSTQVQCWTGPILSFISCHLPTGTAPPKAAAAQDARVAQLVEQRTENPRVGGSNPPPGTITFKDLAE